MNKKKLIKEMKNEFKEWEQAGIERLIYDKRY
jgi:hypothetical protein